MRLIRNGALLVPVVIRHCDAGFVFPRAEWIARRPVNGLLVLALLLYLGEVGAVEAVGALGPHDGLEAGDVLVSIFRYIGMGSI